MENMYPQGNEGSIKTTFTLRRKYSSRRDNIFHRRKQIFPGETIFFPRGSELTILPINT
jgi:hypothetical protein